MIEPVRRSITVGIDRAEAFRLFTDGIDAWWPVGTHSIAADDGNATTERVMFQGREGGHIIEVLTTGEECTWGHVVAWEPPERVVFDWNPSRVQRPPTEVEVTFTTTRAGETQVELVHRGWEALGGDLGRQMRDGYEPGWGFVLAGCYAKATVGNAASA